MTYNSVTSFLKDWIPCSGKSEATIAKALGYSDSKIINLFQSGELALPIEKVPALAKVLNFEPAVLFGLVLSDYFPETYVSIKPFFKGLRLDENELEVLHAYRAFVLDETKRPVLDKLLNQAH